MPLLVVSPSVPPARFPRLLEDRFQSEICRAAIEKNARLLSRSFGNFEASINRISFSWQSRRRVCRQAGSFPVGTNSLCESVITDYPSWLLSSRISVNVELIREKDGKSSESRIPQAAFVKTAFSPGRFFHLQLIFSGEVFRTEDQ